LLTEVKVRILHSVTEEADVARWFYTWPLRWRSLFRRRAVEQELEDELQYHVDRQVQEFIRRGLDPAEARRLVLRDLGGLEQTKERCREVRGVGFVEVLAQDVRYSLRTLRRDPTFALVAILTLALGIGVNAAVFSLVDGILFTRLPFPASDRLVSVTGSYPGGGFAAMRDEIQTLDVAAYAEGPSVTLKGMGEPVRVSGTRVSAELFSVLGVQPQLGRWFRTGEDMAGADHVVILSRALWETRFRADPDAVGQFIELDGVRRQIVGVTAGDFHLPSSRTEVWIPLGLDRRNTATYWAGDFMPVVGRLHQGVARLKAQADVRRFQSRVVSYFPWRMPEDWNHDVALVSLQEALVGPVRPRLWLLSAAVVIVLIIACANVANLTLSRALTRQREMAIRTAIGAAPHRIARQLLTEHVVLALCGGLVGLLFATELLALLKLVLPSDTPRLAEVHLNGRVLGFTGALAIVTGGVFGFVPIAQAGRLSLRPALESGGRGGGSTIAGPFRAMLTIAQIACAVLLLIAASLLMRSLWNLSRGDPGFSVNGIVTASVSPTESVCRDPAECLAFFRAFDAQVQAAPGIVDRALVNTLPLTGAVAKRSLELEGHTLAPSETAPLFWLTVITPDYFRVMQIGFDAGRSFTLADLSGNPPVVILNASTARRFWPGQTAIGKRVRFVGERDWRTVVGVAADARAFDLTRSVPEWMNGTVYVPYAPNATLEDGRIPTTMTVAMSTTLEGPQVAAMLRRAAASVNQDVVIGEIRSMQMVLANAVAGPAATASVLITMAGLALVLGWFGVYGVLSFLVSKQVRDFAIRFALGARRSDVFWQVMRQGGTLCLTGVVIGSAGAVAVTRWISSELHDVSATDPATYAAVAIAVSLVTFIACLVPTLRAMSADPLVLLRDQ
jgi:putative ABC transport system permease protein